eukprot:163870-Hanusia_phi.AAC.3
MRARSDGPYGGSRSDARPQAQCGGQPIRSADHLRGGTGLMALQSRGPVLGRVAGLGLRLQVIILSLSRKV